MKKGFKKRFVSTVKVFHKRYKSWVLPTKIAIILGILGLIVGIIGVIIGLLPLHLDFLVPASELDVSISSKLVREVELQGYPVLEVININAQESLFTLNLWLENKNGKTDIYTQTISVYAGNFGSRVLEEEVFTIKPGEVKKISLYFLPEDIYWESKSYKELEQTNMNIDVKVTYNTKGKTFIQKERFIFLVRGLAEYYNISE